MDNKLEKYKDIINLPHHVSKKYPQMSLKDRAAQFGAFAALTGYQDEIKETERITINRIELDEEEKLNLNNKLKLIQDNIQNNPRVKIKYFVPDVKKDGGKYIEVFGKILKVDEYKREIIMQDKTKIPIREIIEIKDE